MQAMRGRPEAAAAIWNPAGRAQAAERARVERLGSARRRGVVQAVVGLVVASLLFAYGATLIAKVVFAVTALLVLVSRASPLGAYAQIERGLAAFGRAVGTAMTWLLMVPVFYLIFLPFGLAFRRGASDRMRRRFDPEATTYWRRRDDGKSGSGGRTP